MLKSLDDYRGIVEDSVLSEIYRCAARLSSKHVVHISSTYQGGGVAEMLNSLVVLMNDIGVLTGWRILHGTPDFFTITKKFHNGLHGDQINLSEMKQRIYSDVNANFSRFTHINHDFVIVHDPQPLPLIKFYRKRQPWIWRCHVDLSHPDPNLWEYLKTFILRYDLVIVSDEKYIKKELPVQQRILHPSIDPLSPKNVALNSGAKAKFLNKFGIPCGKPIIAQISRFDKWKDPMGVLRVFDMVRSKVDCRLVLCGNMAPDDPEGEQIYRNVLRKVGKDKDIIVLMVENQVLVNVIQSTASVILQKSIREGFGLTASEALWKGTPVVASNVGGLPLQVIDGKTGFVVDPTDIKGCAEKVIMLLKDRALAEKLGENGREHVRKNFLLTRSILDYLRILIDMLTV